MSGPQADLAIGSGELGIVVAPALGGRVLSLADRRTGREWLVRGGRPERPDGWADERAAFLGPEAWGWDECLPTVTPCPDPLVPGGPLLRDHGDAWGREAAARLAGPVLEVEVAPARWPYRLRRSYAVEGPRLTIRYELANGGASTLPFLWSMHPLLALEPGSRVLLPGVARARLTHAAGTGLGPPPADVAWPLAERPDGTVLDLAEVRGVDAGQAIKLYARAEGAEGRAAATAPDGSWLAFAWDAAFAPVTGLWLDAGGWPEGDPRAQVAIEPTTSADDDLAGALAGRRAVTVAPGERRTWWVRIELGRPDDAGRLAELLG